MTEIYAVPISPELTHHGIKGQKWGVRRFQNEDGTLTSAGKKHYRSANRDTRIKEHLHDTLYRSGLASAAFDTASGISKLNTNELKKVFKAGKTGYKAAKTAMKMAKFVGIDTAPALVFATKVGTTVAGGITAAIDTYGTAAVVGLGGIGVVATGAAVYAAVKGGQAIANRVSEKKNNR